MVSPPAPELLLPDALAWRGWLAKHHATSPAVRLVLARKGGNAPTDLLYPEALAEALCFGWIDGQLGRRDEVSYLQRFTHRRPGSRWSLINVRAAERLIAAGRMEEAGMLEVSRARADGRWENAYAGSAAIEVPADLRSALAADPAADEAFSRLSRQNRYSILYRLRAGGRPEARAGKIAEYVAMLARGETIHPQRGDPR